MPASVTTEELGDLVRGVRFVDAALAHPVDKDALSGEMLELKRTFGKSVVAARALEAGTRLAETDLALKKPGTGIPAARLGDVVGSRLRHAVDADTLLSEEDLDPQLHS